MLSIKSPEKKVCRSIMFEPYPHLTAVGLPETRTFNVELLPNIIAESNVQFDNDISPSGGPPRLLVPALPVGTTKLQVKLVQKNDSDKVIVGVLFIVDGSVLLVQRFQKQLNLDGVTVSDGVVRLIAEVENTEGIVTNDRKQRLI